ncbi:MAG: HAMP domain-containing protein [Spirochaetales bacterium]|nr:HAMP domain-containing protein [Spirochaetales bacterium]
MKKKTLFRELFINFLIIVLAAVVLTALYATFSFRNFYFAEISLDLEQRARLIEPQIRTILLAEDKDTNSIIQKMETLCENLGERGEFRITVILPSGKVIGDSDEKALAMEDHGQRPEVVEALSQGYGMNVRFSNTLQQEMMYVAVPLMDKKRIAGIVRVAMSINELNQTLNTLWIILLIGGVVFMLLAALLIYVRSKRISKPLLKLRKSAELISRGNFEERVEIRTSFELSSLGHSMNIMAEQLKQRINTILRQRAQADAILLSMVEGVIAVDSDKKVISVNKPACDLFHLDKDIVPGQRIEEVVSASEILLLIDEVLKTSQYIEKEITLYNEQERLLQVVATNLSDREEHAFGVLLVLRDVTRLRRLENVRKDFAMNVSHELRTPLTSIKGFVETILENTLNNPGETERFLSIISRQTERVIAIVDDLMSLARLEKDTERGGIELSVVKINDVITQAVNSCLSLAEAKKIQIKVECDPELKGKINTSLFEQAIVNLIDNAVKYSGENTAVEVTAKEMQDSIHITVKDYGCGIGQEHLKRIFERFYRVDKARSSELGGTGLGLAIVKHIAQAHGGRAEVESEEGEGSTFSIIFPAIL